MIAGDVKDFRAGAVQATAVYRGTEQIWPVAAPAYVDDFDRADDPTGLGPDWTIRNGGVGILNGGVYATRPASWCIATSDAAGIAGDDMAVSMTIGPSLGGADHSGDYAIVLLGASEAGEGVMVDTSPALGGFGIYTFTDWALSSAANVASAPGVWTEGDVLTLHRVGAGYTVLLNGADIGCDWVDGAGVIPRDSDHWLTGLGMFNTGNGGLTLDAFGAVTL